jgi:hypothetical protein
MNCRLDQGWFADPGPPRHDPGGKVSTALPKGVTGAAEYYGDKEQYRLWLRRLWDAGDHASPYLLWIGMNPSTATAEVNDPTVTRIIGFSKSWGYSHAVICNVMDYRATHPNDLLAVTPRSDRNMETILRFAHHADKIIMCHGILAPAKTLAHYGDEAKQALIDAGYLSRMFCLGKTLLKKPKHPLFLAGDTKLEPYP